MGIEHDRSPNNAPSQSSAPKANSGFWSGVSATIESFLNALTSLLKVAVVAFLLGWAYLHQDFLEKWLWGLSGGEVLGFKFTRELIDQATAELEKRIGQDKYALDDEAIRGSLIRASRIAPAIVNSRVLWVDDKPAWNAPIADLLRQRLKIIVVPVSSTAEALEAMQISPYDLVITNIWRPNDPENRQRKLSLCRVHYFDFPDPLLANEYLTKRRLKKMDRRLPSPSRSVASMLSKICTVLPDLASPT
jgi:CheY-like chemotaxis protein